MLQPKQTAVPVQQSDALQGKVDHLLTENRRLLLELITLYSKYTGLLQEIASLKSRTGKPEKPVPAEGNAQ